MAADLIEPEPKVFELLHYLARNRGRVVSKAELLDSLWSGEVIGESALTRCVSCARKLVGDDSRTPRFIRTIHGRGYEFIAPLVERTGSEADPATAASAPASPAVNSTVGEREFVGRAAELNLLRTALSEIASLRQRMVLVTGEAGIGKIRLVEELSRQAAGLAQVHWGTAFEHGGRAAVLDLAGMPSLDRQTTLDEDGAPGLQRSQQRYTEALLGMDRWQADDSLGGIHRLSASARSTRSRRDSPNWRDAGRLFWSSTTCTTRTWCPGCFSSGQSNECRHHSSSSAWCASGNPPPMTTGAACCPASASPASRRSPYLV